MNRIKIVISFILMSLVHFACNAQLSIFKASKIHTGDGVVHETAFLVVEGEKIAFVGVNLPEQYSNAPVTDLGEAQIYPAVIALNTQLGLKEIDAVRATRDFREVGKFNPNARTLIAYNTDSEVAKTIVSNGILFAQICPLGGRISGKSCAVKLRAWNWEDAAIIQEDGIHLNWPKKYQKQGWWADTKPDKKLDTYQKELSELEHFFSQSKAYQGSEDEEFQKFEAISQILEGKLNLYIHVNDAQTMMDALNFCERWKIEPIFYGAEEAAKILPLLKKHRAKVVLTKTKSLPAQIDEPILQNFGLASELSQNGIPFAISMEGAWEQRNLIFQASQAVSYGLNYDEAIKSISLTAAEIMGMDELRGSLKEGKFADFIVSKGDLLEINESIVIKAYMNGKSVDLDDKQKALYRKYKAKYGL